LSTETTATELVPTPPRKRSTPAPVSPTQLLAAAVERGADIAVLERLMDLQERSVKAQAKQAYDQALAAFKSEAIDIIKRKEVDYTKANGSRTNYKHAELSDVIEAVGPALSRHGFSWSWATAQKDRTWVEVTCTLRHQQGHSESVTLGGPADDSGGKNAIQAIGSTVQYLSRYTLKAITGVSEKGDDNDGNGGARAAEWADRALAAENEDELAAIRRDGQAAFKKSRDVDGFAAFMRAVGDRSKALKGKA
jgi:hypothetical protein